MDVEDLESAIDSAKSNEVSEKSVPVSQDTEVGFHRGALRTLMAERNELVKMLRNIEAIAEAHIKRLKELGENS
ncbi:hypothetical protein KAT36_01395 [Candidatus Pacearchaeota archaeon]|nr:hypothetical protein [Candidatus Pacearchaeota archaeon]